MKGVVRPHARPTRRKPSVQLMMEGDGDGEGGSEGLAVDMVGVEEGRIGKGMGWSEGEVGRSDDTVGDALRRLLVRSVRRKSYVF